MKTKLNTFNLRKSIFNLRTDFLRVFPEFYCKPSQISIEVTDRCNSRCITCHYWKNKGRDLPKKLIDKFVNELLDWLGHREIMLTGGEPLLRRDIFEIINNIYLKGGYAKILTNGLLLDDKTIDRLVKSHISKIAISVNGIDPKIHDSSRGVPGNLAKILSAVDYIKKNYPNLIIDFTMIIYKQNLNQIIPTIEYANKKDIYLNFQPIHPIFSKNPPDTKDDKDALKEFLPRDLKKVSQIFRKVKKYKLEGYPIPAFNSYLKHYLDYFNNPNKTGIKKCKIGFYNLILENNGDMKLCYNYPRLGNIKQTTPKKLWKSKLARQQRNQMLNCSINCGSLLCTLRPNFRDFFERLFILISNRLSRI